MTIRHLVIREIFRRKINFFLGLLSVVIAVAALVGSVISLTIHDRESARIIRQKEQETEDRMKSLEDDYRKIMKKLGFNLLIVPEGQNLADLFDENFASKYMPEAYADQLAASGIMSIRHLLPSLQQRIYWEKGKRSAILIGTRGEVPLLHRDQKEPMLVAVPPGSVVVGHELHKSQGLSVGDRIRILTQDFTITRCNEERGNKDDITFWIDLKQAQKLLHRPDQINAVLALKCHCAGNDISKIRAEIAAILPGTQVIEEVSKVITRTEARDRAAQEAEQSLRAEKEPRRQMREEQERFAAIVVPAVIGFSMLWIALMFLMNVRERRSEIAILRAVGVNKHKILILFLLKALLMGISGSLIGILLAYAFCLVRYTRLIDPIHLNWQTILLVVILAPLISVLASWLPAFMASQQDPAVVLSEEA